MVDLGMIWHVYGVVCAFILLTARLAPAGKPFRLTLPEIVAASFPVGMICNVWLVFIIACLTSAIGNHTVFASVLVWAYLVWEHAEDFSKNIGPLIVDAFAPSQRLANFILSGLLGVAGMVLVPLYNTRMLKEEGPGRVFSGGSCWADLPMHMTVAESFIHGRNQDVSWSQMIAPVFAGETMAYPFLPDFHAAVMVKMGGVNLRWAFLSTGLPLALAMTALIFTLSLRITRSPLGSLFAVMLVYGTGGAGGWNIWRRDGLASALNQDVAQNDVTGEGKAVWFAFLPHVVLPQRGANFAYPATLVVLTLVWQGTAWAGAGVAAMDVWDRAHLLGLAGGLAALLPLVQAHSFLALATIIGTVFVLDAHKWLANPRLLMAWGAAGVVAGVIAIPQLRLFSSRVNEGAGGKFLQYGWWFIHHDSGSGGGITGFFKFWWLNTGPSLILSILSIGLLAWECFQAWRVATGAVERSATEGKATTLLDLADATCAYSSEVAPPYTPALSTPPLLGGGGGGAPSSATAAAASAVAAAASAKAKVKGSSGAGRAAHTTGGEDEEVEDSPKEDAPKPKQGRRASSVTASASSSSASASASSVGDGALSPRVHAGAGAGGFPQGEPHFLLLLWDSLKRNIKDDSGGVVDVDRLLDITRLTYRTLDTGFGLWMNRCSLTGRGLDALKFALGAFNVFLLGNYVMFQPWDRDNCKMWYVGLFVNGAIVGGMLAAPLEAFLYSLAPSLLPARDFPGFHRLLALSAPADTPTFTKALWLAQEEVNGALPSVWLRKEDKVAPYWYSGGSGGVGGEDDKTPEGKRGKERREAYLRAGLSVDGGKVGGELAVRARALGALSLVGALPALFLMCLTGFMMVYREFGLYHQMLDPEQFEMADYLLANVPPKGVILHRDIHISPAGCLSGRISLIGYNGWMWSHGYNYNERERDRAYVLDNALKDSDTTAYNILRRWGVRYVLGENLKTHHRPAAQAYEEALARGNPENITYDADAYLDGQLKSTKKIGRYELLEVQGYGFPPV